MNGVIMAERCNWCSKQFPGSQLTKISTGQKMCNHCREWHWHAQEVLAGGMPRGCQECGKSAQVLIGADPNELAVRMFVLPKDGIFQLLCQHCKDIYCAKRSDLYRGTEFGQKEKI